jgi:hypothetical protein
MSDRVLDNSIYTTLNAALTGTTLTLTPATFGGGIHDVIHTYGTLTVGNVHLVQDGDAVTFTAATGASPPLTGMAIDARFAPAPDLPGGVTMTLTAVPPSGWTFAAGWPLLARGPADQLTITAATFTLSSVAVPQGPGKGLSFAGDLGPPPGWGALGWLLGAATALKVTGQVGQQGTVPAFAFSAKLGSADVPVLGPLSVAFVFECTPVAAQNADPFPQYPYVPGITLGVVAQIQIAAAPVPVFIDLAMLPGALPVVADVSKLKPVQISDIAELIGGHDLAAKLPPAADFDPGQYLVLKTLNFLIDPSGPAMLIAGCTLGTIKKWPITDGLSAGPVSLNFLVDTGTGDVFATLTGDVTFTGGALRLGAAYPGFVFTGCLTEGSTVSLSSLISSVLNGTPVPELTMDQLDVGIEPMNGGSFSLTTGLTGDWGVPVGPARLALTGAYLQLNRAPAGTTGTIAAQATLTPPGTVGAPITFDGSWTLPGTFSLTGNVPLLHLTELARFSGVPLPDGVPEVDLAQAVLAIVYQNEGSYTFAVTAHAAVSGTDLGSATFAVRKTATAFGFLIGIVIAEGWSPARIWPELASVFGDITFTRSGLLISTLPAGSPVNLPALQGLPSLPATAPPGFAFFSTVKLEGPALGWLAGLFDAGMTLDLLAIVDTTAPANSSFTAALRAASDKNQLTWTELSVTLRPAATTFELQAAGSFQFPGNDKPLQLKGTGSVTLEPPSAKLALEVDNWVHPFGIENLVVQVFALQVGYQNGKVSIDLYGSFLIGAAPRAFLMKLGVGIVDFEAPKALLFELSSPDKLNPLLLSDIILQFTSLDLSSVPVLKDISFVYLQFALVADPDGFTIAGYHFPPGIGVAADILLWDWEAKFSIVVNAGTGIKASGQINKPITLGEVFSLSDTTGKTGPSGLIDTSKLPARTDRQALAELRDRRAIGGADPYFTLDGKLKFLGIEETIKASAAGQTFDFELTFAFLNTVTANLGCHLADAKHLSASAEIGFDLDVTIGPYSVDGIPLIPEVHITAPKAALTLGIAVNPDVIVALALGLKYSWQGKDYAVGFALSLADIASELTQLWPAIKTWLKNSAQRVFNEALADASVWIELLLGPFAALAEDINAVAAALATFFRVAAQDAAALFVRLGYEFMAIVDALVEFFMMAFDDAMHLVESLVPDCAMQNAEVAAYQAPPSYTMRDVAFALTGSPAGQHLLEIWYSHQDEIGRLLAAHPYLHDQLRSFVASPQRARDARLMADTALSALFLIMPDASPGLSQYADELIEALMRYRDMSVPAVLAELGARP